MNSSEPSSVNQTLPNSTRLVDADFVQVLKDNPDLFLRHPELLEFINLTDSRDTSSLLEKQVAALQQRLAAVKSQQHDFIDALCAKYEID